MIFNKYLSKEQKLKVNFFKGLGIGLLFLILTILIYQFIMIPRIEERTRVVTLKNMEQKKSQQIGVYTINKNIEKGQAIDIEKDIDLVKKNTNEVPENYIQDISKIKGQLSRINLDKNIVITNSMFIDMSEYITNDLKNQDYSHIVLHKFLKKNDYVDIRYKKKDGSDFIVVSKKRIKELNGQTISIDILEQERFYLNNATVEADIAGGTIYTTIYPDPHNQEAAKVTYEINSKIKDMIEKDPNIIKESEKNLRDRKGAVDISKPSEVGSNSKSDTDEYAENKKPVFSSDLGGNK